MPITRKIDLFAFLLGCFSLGAALYLEIYAGLKPCPLCTVQRIILLVTLLLFLIGALLPLINFARRFYHFIVFLVASSGVTIAARHTWLTLQPAAATTLSCEANINLMLKYLPFKEAAKLIFESGGDCRLTTWRFLHLNLPEWSLLCFICLALIALWQVLHKDKLWAR